MLKSIESDHFGSVSNIPPLNPQGHTREEPQSHLPQFLASLNSAVSHGALTAADVSEEVKNIAFERLFPKAVPHLKHLTSDELRDVLISFKEFPLASVDSPIGFAQALVGVLKFRFLKIRRGNGSGSGSAILPLHLVNVADDVAAALEGIDRQAFEEDIAFFTEQAKV